MAGQRELVSVVLRVLPDDCCAGGLELRRKATAFAPLTFNLERKERVAP